MDFSGQNLRGRNFKGQNLTGANFSYTDIRGANFTNATLKGANFTGAKAGLLPSWSASLFIVSIALSVLGLGTSLISAFSFSSAKLVYWAAIITVDFPLQVGKQLPIPEIPVLELLILILCFAFIIAGQLIGDFTDKTKISLELFRSFQVKSKVVAKISFLIAFAIWISFFISSGKINSRDITLILLTWLTLGISFGMFFALFLGLIFAYPISSRNVLFDSKRTIFRNADLTDADFTGALLAHADFKKSTLTRTCWFQAWTVKCAHIKDTYLEDFYLRGLLITKEGKGQVFYNSKNTREANLEKANLVDSIFVDSDLSQANLRGANLSNAKLIRTRLDQADLTGACLTGAFIQDWGIKTTTKFSGVKCEYVYMRFPTRENPDPLRKPDNRDEVFEDGDFEDFVKPLTDTLDLYHNHGIDPRAIAIAFKNLAEDNPEADLEIVALEKRGKGKFLLRAKTAPGIDKSELSQAYFDDYNQLKALPANHPLRLLLDEKDDRIRSLENMVETALKQPKFYTENYHHRGDVMPENSGVNINASGNIGDISGLVGGDVSGVVNLGEISGNVTNTINQLPASPQPDEPGIKELLEQLHRAIESAEELKPEDKAEALKQVQALAEAGKDPAEPEKKNGAKSAIRWLKGMLTELAEPSAIVQLCKHVLPQIAGIFGL